MMSLVARLMGQLDVLAVPKLPIVRMVPVFMMQGDVQIHRRRSGIPKTDFCTRGFQEQFLAEAAFLSIEQKPKQFPALA